MQEWNAVITVFERGFERACQILGDFGKVKRTDFFNTLVMKADDVEQMLETLRSGSLEDPEFLTFLSRLVPVTSTFTFQSPEEFESKSKKAALAWVHELGDKGFHVRMRRRGFKGKLSSLEEERFLDDILLEALKMAGVPGHITFENPDAIIAVETIANWAGLSLWTREQLQRYPFIRLK
jgi:tRNA(Ser,Leu) C12 N-acetylase TAN1